MTKVYGCSLGLYRHVTAARSQAVAAKAMGISMRAFRDYASETGNPIEVELAMSDVGSVWRRDYRGSFVRESYVRIK